MIYNERIRLRAPERADLPRFVEWLNDPEVRIGLAMHLPFSLAEEEVWFEAMIKRPPSEHVLVIEVRSEKYSDNWNAIGTCSFHDIDWRIRKAEVGIVIGEKGYWNKGYGTDVMRLLLRHGFNTLNLNRIMLRVYSTNPRAMRAYEKAGFVVDGRLRQAGYKDGQYFDEIIMSVLREEWQP